MGRLALQDVRIHAAGRLGAVGLQHLRSPAVALCLQLQDAVDAGMTGCDGVRVVVIQRSSVERGGNCSLVHLVLVFLLLAELIAAQLSLQLGSALQGCLTEHLSLLLVGQAAGDGLALLVELGQRVVGDVKGRLALLGERTGFRVEDCFVLPGTELIVGIEHGGLVRLTHLAPMNVGQVASKTG
ncbi:hypothetical protein D3C77_561790 [compost metagenome]